MASRTITPGPRPNHAGHHYLPASRDRDYACDPRVTLASSLRVVSSYRRQIFRSDEPAFIPVSEAWLVFQTAALAIFSAWAFGGVIGWTQNWILGLALAGVPIAWLRRRASGDFSIRPFLPALLWVCFVTISVFNPSHARGPNRSWVQRDAWISWLPTTPDVSHTFADARVWLAALLLGAIVSSLLRSPRATRILWGILALNGFALAAVGAFFHFAGTERLLGLMDGPEPTYFFATFFYKNHWAAFGTLSSACALALSLQSARAALAGDPAARGPTLLFGGAGLLTAVTLPLPGSRAGLLMGAANILVFLGLLSAMAWRARGRGRPVRLWGVTIGALLAGGILAFGAAAYAPRATADLSRTQQQLSATMDRATLDVRLQVSRDTWRMACARPWFGWGPGSYEIVFPIFQGHYLRRPDGRAEARFEFAHNDWLQLLAETGLVGAGFLVIPAAMVALRRWRRAGRAGRFGLFGCALVAAHAWIDFPFHNPAVLMLWVVLLTSAARLDEGPELEPVR